MQILDALAERSNVKLFFHHELRKMTLDQNTVEFENKFGSRNLIWPLNLYFWMFTDRLLKL